MRVLLGPIKFPQSENSLSLGVEQERSEFRVCSISCGAKASFLIRGSRIDELLRFKLVNNFSYQRFHDAELNPGISFKCTNIPF
ncbi:hypothetical protein RCL_jg7941.t1 [Rhizophagus clarus]|uniref:Uncharacterized protein n=1 Tax=Rhizophagus clarus TaxID=94130 RepID=A0A8H3R5V0_9GLOM|nr:hypothetical protein RCL_jg7941.t1 [Rhizophagus clarus]